MCITLDIINYNCMFTAYIFHRSTHHHTTSHNTPSHYTTSHHITHHHTPSYHTTPHHTPSHHITHHHTPSYHTPSYHTPSHITSNPPLSPSHTHRALFEQFRRVANLYFLLLSVLMTIGTYSEFFDSPLDPWSTLFPLFVVIGVRWVKGDV